MAAILVALFAALNFNGTPASLYTPRTATFSGSLTTDVWGIFDVQTGAVIDGQNIDTVKPIASVTKLFTAFSVMQSSVKDTPGMVTWDDVAAEGRAGRLAVGDRMTPYTLLFPLLMESSNDAAAAIERMLGPSFLTGTARAIKEAELTSTQIADASGLSAANTSTVRDLAALFAYLRHAHPHIFDISELNMYIGENTEYHNTSPARSFDAFVGGKHGYTDEAGRTFVGAFAVGDGGGEVGIVLLGSTNLSADITALHAFSSELSASGILEHTSLSTP